MNDHENKEVDETDSKAENVEESQDNSGNKKNELKEVEKSIEELMREGYFLRETSKIMCELEDMMTLKDINKRTEVSYSYIATKIKEFEKMGLVETVKKGRERKVMRKAKGKKLSRYLKKVQTLITEIRHGDYD